MAKLPPLTNITDNLEVGDEILVEGSFEYTSYIIAVDKKYAYLGKKERIGESLSNIDIILCPKLHIGREGTHCRQVNFSYVTHTFLKHKDV